MPPLPIFNNRALLISPLEIPVYLLELPTNRRGSNPQGSGQKEALLEGELRNRLKALYPGAPENTAIDYTLEAGNKTHAPQAVVYVSSRETCEGHRSLGRPLIPGTALMRLALRGAGLATALCVIATEEWVEAAFFEDARLLRCGSAPAAASGGLPFSFVASLASGGEKGPAAALFIRAGSPAAQNETAETMLRQFFDPVRTLDLTDIAARGTLKNLGVFNDSRRRSRARRRRITGALLLLNGVSLLLSLHIVSGRTRLELSRLEQQEREQREVLDRAKELERRLAELEAAKGAATRSGGADPYGLIAGLRSCLSGGWIRSLVIQGEHFDLEAEGVDSIEALQSLQTSGRFGELSLRRASKSPVAGDQFTISGRAIAYGNE
jgi:hypothetical protein